MFLFVPTRLVRGTTHVVFCILHPPWPFVYVLCVSALAREGRSQLGREALSPYVVSRKAKSHTPSVITLYQVSQKQLEVIFS